MSSTARIHSFFKSLPEKAYCKGKDESLLRNVLIKQTMYTVRNIVTKSSNYPATELIKIRSDRNRVKMHLDFLDIPRQNTIKRQRLNSVCSNDFNVNTPIKIKIKID